MIIMKYMIILTLSCITYIWCVYIYMYDMWYDVYLTHTHIYVMYITINEFGIICLIAYQL